MFFAELAFNSLHEPKAVRILLFKSADFTLSIPDLILNEKVLSCVLFSKF